MSAKQGDPHRLAARAGLASAAVLANNNQDKVH